MNIPFNKVYDCLAQFGPAEIISSRGTKYKVEAGIIKKGERKGEQVIKAYPRKGCVYIHADCWGDDITCQNTRAGGIYNGKYTIYNWYLKNELPKELLAYSQLKQKVKNKSAPNFRIKIRFDDLELGKAYDRPYLAKYWGYKGYEAISRGVVTPAGTPFIILFITKEKQAFLTQYEDVFANDILEIEGEKSHLSDQRIVESLSNEDEAHLFYREKHHMPFTYEGRVFLVDYILQQGRPSNFRFAVDKSTAIAISTLETEEITHGTVDSEFISDPEGRKKIIQHVTYERSKKNRAKAIQIHGTICKACGFNFNKTYGTDFAKDYIEIHHAKSISKQNGEIINPETDLIPLCSNCHSMAHRKRGNILSVAEIRTLLIQG